METGCHSTWEFRQTESKEYAILLMKYPLAVLRSERGRSKKEFDKWVSTPFEGRQPYNGSQTQSSDAVTANFLYVSNPLSEHGVP